MLSEYKVRDTRNAAASSLTATPAGRTWTPEHSPPHLPASLTPSSSSWISEPVTSGRYWALQNPTGF